MALTSKQLSAALLYAEAGFRVFPVHSIKNGRCSCGKPECGRNAGKHPKPTNGLDAGTVDPDEVREYWQEYGLDSNVGIVCDGLLVIDADAAKGGLEQMRRLVAEFDLPKTWEVETGSGGRHLYYKLPDGIPSVSNRVNAFPGIDVRSTRGYVLAPPSNHQSGGKYRWLQDFRTIPMATAPMELIMALEGTRRQKIDQSAVIAGVPEGERNDSLFRLACSLRDSFNFETALPVVLTAASKCNPPYPEADAVAIVQRVYETYPQKTGPREIAEPDAPDISFALTDLGNAERLAYRLQGKVRYCAAYRRFLWWDDRRWVIDDSAGAPVYQAAFEMVRWMQETALILEGSARKDLMGWGLKCEVRARIESCIELLKKLPGVAVSPSELDRHPMLFNTQTGILNLETGELMPFDRKLLLTQISPVEYDPAAECPTWFKYLDDVTRGDRPTQEFLWTWMGYCLTGSIVEQAFAFHHGDGSNGKSTYHDVLGFVMGDYAQTIQTEELMSRDNGRSSETTLDRAKSARVLLAKETEENHKLNEALIKTLTGGDRVVARKLYGDPYEYLPEYKLDMFGNHKPRVRGTDHGVWRRVRLVPWLAKFSDEDKDKSMPERLRAEAPGILRWMVLGCIEWQKSGLGTSEGIREATAEYRESQDVLGHWLSECCVTGSDEKDTAGNLYDSYRRWCETTGEFKFPQTAFCLKLADRGFDRARGAKGVRCYTGIRAVNLPETGQDARRWDQRD